MSILLVLASLTFLLFMCVGTLFLVKAKRRFNEDMEYCSAQLFLNKASQIVAVLFTLYWLLISFGVFSIAISHEPEIITYLSAIASACYAASFYILYKILT